MLVSTMLREITERELQHEAAAIVQALERGESFVVTHHGVIVGELVPKRRRQFVPADEAQHVFAQSPRLDATRFRDEVDAILDQDPTPRA